MKRNYAAKKLMVSILTASMMFCYPFTVSASEMPDDSMADSSTENYMEEPEESNTMTENHTEASNTTTENYAEASNTTTENYTEEPNAMTEDSSSISMPAAAEQESSQDSAESLADETFEGVWKKSRGRWWFQTTDGGYLSNNIYTIAGKNYAFDAAGWMVVGWYKQTYEDQSSIWYYFNGSGAMTYGWQKVKQKWYYLDPEYGFMYSDGLYKLDDTYYYLLPSGAMLTGWHKELFENGSFSWYYFHNNGSMAYNWQKINRKWYYLNPEYGYMHTGWIYLDNVWYYLNPNGDMATGWKKINNIWYYFANSGAMQTNKWIGNYYVQSDGSMAVNKWIGKYFVGPDGCWIKLNANETIIPVDEGNGTGALVVGTIDNSMSNEVFRQLNAYRASKGLPQLKQANSKLQEAVNLRSAECVIKFSHDRPNGKNCFSVYENACAENIICGLPMNASIAMDEWKNSPGHNTNMLNTFATSVGIGTFRLRDGSAYCVQLFSFD